MTEQQISNRGLEAAQVLESQAYKDAMEALRGAVVAKWREVSVRDKEGLVLTHQLMTLADTFEGILAGYVEAGKFAARSLDLDHARNETPMQSILRRTFSR
jgi:hypothetical protein